MKIQECFVQNFGGLQEYHFCPEEPFEYLCAPNGSGKTTFAAFVCAMFYGLGSARTRKNLDEAQRKKYKPWQQGTWGGWIRFTAGGKQYRIERTFSEKEREDTFALIDTETGRISQDYTENIGEELFGMTKATYLATAFMSWNHMRVEVNENMRIGFFDGAQDEGLLKSEQAATAIEAEYREYKKTGNRGELAQVTEELNRLSMQEWKLSQQIKQLSEQETLKSLQTEKVWENTQTKKPGGSITGVRAGLTADEEERLAFLDDYFAAGIDHIDGHEQKLTKLREQKKACRLKMQQTKRRYSTAVFVAAAGLVLGILSAVAIKNLPVAVCGGAVCLAGAAALFLLRSRTAQYGQEIEVLDEAEEQARMEADYAREYQMLSQKEELFVQMQQNFQKQRQEEKQAGLEEQQKLVLQKKQQLQQRKAQIEHRMEVLEKTGRYLAEAKQAYISHLAKDLSTPFYAYLSAFDKELAEKVQLNADYEIGIVDNGILRQIDYYSSGIKDVIWFCERMAFIQKLSAREKPVIVLDDVFLALDGAMQKKAFEMLRRISQDFQIIYLSCHEYAVL